MTVETLDAGMLLFVLGLAIIIIAGALCWLLDP